MTRNNQIKVSPKQRDAADLAQRENAFRDGFISRREGVPRGSNPHDREHLSRCVSAARLDQTVAEHANRRAVWDDGWLTADNTARLKGESRLSEVPLYVPPPRRIKKHREQLFLDGTDELAA